MTFYLENSPLDFVVIQVSTTTHAALPAKIPAVALKMIELGFPTDKTKSEKQFSVSPQGTFAKQVQIWNFVNDAKNSFVSIREGSLSLVTSAYDDFDHFKGTFFKVLDSLAVELSFLRTTAVSLRYINSLFVDQFPTPLISDVYQGGMWDLGYSHVHSDHHGWADTKDPDGRITIKSKMVKSHPVKMDGVDFLEALLPNSSGEKGESTACSLGFDLSEFSRPFKQSLEINSDQLIDHLDVQHSRIKQLFETVLTEDSKKKWGYERK